MAAQHWSTFCAHTGQSIALAVAWSRPPVGAEVLTADAVHELRVTCKRLRAAWQVVRSADWEGAERHREARTANALLRDTARALAGPREAHVLRKTLIRLTRNTEDAELLATLELLLEVVRQRYPMEAVRAVELPDLPALFVDQQARWQALGELQCPAALPLAGPVRSYRRAAGLARRGIRSGHPADFHNWRRWVKYELYQLELLGGATFWRGRLRRLDRLGDEIGRYHDLCDLRSMARSADFAERHPQALAVLEREFERRFRRAETRFVKQFARLYGRSEHRYARRLRQRLEKA